MEMRDIFRDFIHRTNENLKAIEELAGRDSKSLYRSFYKASRIASYLYSENVTAPPAGKYFSDQTVLGMVQNRIPQFRTIIGQ